MVVVSNTSPLIYLTKIGELRLLEVLFSEIILADMVYEEVVIQGAGMPGSDEVRNAAWIKRQSVLNKALVQKLQNENLIDAGEAETLVLAQELKADLILIDERKARKLAVKDETQKSRHACDYFVGLQKGSNSGSASHFESHQTKSFRNQCKSL